MSGFICCSSTWHMGFFEVVGLPTNMRLRVSESVKVSKRLGIVQEYRLYYMYIRSGVSECEMCNSMQCDSRRTCMLYFVTYMYI